MYLKQGTNHVALVTIYEIGKILSLSLDIHKTLRQVLNVIATHLYMSRGMVCLCDDSDELCIASSIGLSEEEVLRGRFRFGEGITGRVFQSGVPAVVPNVAHEPLFLNRTGVKRRVDDLATAFIGVPIKIGRECIGVLAFERETNDTWSGFQDDLQLLTMVANLIGQTIRLHRQEKNERELLLEDKSRLQAEAELRETESRFSAILNSLDEIIWSASAPDFQLHHVSAATERLYGVSQQAFLDDPTLWLKLVHPDDKLRVKEATSRILELGKTEIEYRILRSDGQERWLSDRMYVIYGANGEPVELVGAAYDVTERKLTEAALRGKEGHLLLSEQRAKKSLEELKSQKFALDKHAIVAVTDVQGRITYANEKFCEISGYSQEELIGKDHAILNSGYHPKGFFREMYRTMASGTAWHDEVCNSAKDGRLYWVDTTIAPFMGDDGKPQSYISIRTDITQRKAAEERSNHLAFYDALTELPNRRLLLDRLNQALVASARSHKRGALLFLDLDHFKTLNDTLGHDVGDLLLQQVAVRLTSSVREGDTVARLGGDEFVVLLEDLSEHAVDAAAQIEVIGHKVLASLNQPYQLASYDYHSTPSIGATIFSGHTLSVEELLKQADIAMYQSKEAGRNAIRFFDPNMQEIITARASMEQELRKAIEQRQFQLHYQIQVDSTGKPLGAEALIRWLHPERGMISPFHFISLAEETGLILPIGQWVLESACAQLSLWQKNLLTSDLVLAVNVSAKQFRQVDFVAQVQATVQRLAINPMLLKLELTESMLLEDIDDIIATMHALKVIGISFSLDDFGTGYSSLQYLKKLPLDQLKVDQSFVRDIVTDNSDKAIVRTIITMAQNLNLDVIAEGVETKAQRQFLMSNGCMHYQGYLFSKPVPLAEFELLLHRQYAAILDSKIA
ncbi:cyclic di-GMP phosphodiesterase Gmr [mine drainage metagenome]|uniref:Cyclic di-GMP phosphodiesterase Gmr n=1 Tax=mine drainage metagenome TaxID=410659 RepID=A0A1J5TAF2_9ZZZZ